MYERAREAANVLVRIIRGELRPTMALECPPLLTPLQTQVTTHDTPMKRIIDLVHRLEEDPRVISIAAFGGSPLRILHRLASRAWLSLITIRPSPHAWPSR